MIQEILNTVKLIEEGAAVDPTWTLVVIAIGVIAIVATIIGIVVKG